MMFWGLDENKWSDATRRQGARIPFLEYWFKTKTEKKKNKGETRQLRMFSHSILLTVA
ncbi:MAG: hypothetical protein ACRC10_07445 [Thermoguttaceae bacterium]